MHVVLVVEPEVADADQVLQRLGRDCIVIRVASPLQAVYALHAVQFTSVIVAIDRADKHDYASLFATLRTGAPGTVAICVPPLPAKRIPSHEAAVDTWEGRNAALVS